MYFYIIKNTIYNLNYTLKEVKLLFEAYIMVCRILKPNQPEVTGFSYCKKYKFYYTSKNKCKDFDAVSILGELDLKNKNLKDDTGILFEVILKNGNMRRYSVKPLEGTIKDTSLLVYVGNNEYIAINKKKSIILSKLSGLTIPLIAFISINSVALAFYKITINNINLKDIIENSLLSNQKPIIEDAEDWNGELPINNQNSNSISESKSEISIPGYSQLYVDSKNCLVSLINPTSNDVYFKYIIEINDSVIYSSNMIKPGKSLNINLFEKLKKGTYIANFKIETYDMVTMEKYNGATQKVNIEVK